MTIKYDFVTLPFSRIRLTPTTFAKRARGIAQRPVGTNRCYVHIVSHFLSLDLSFGAIPFRVPDQDSRFVTAGHIIALDSYGRDIKGDSSPCEAANSLGDERERRAKPLLNL